MLLKVGAAMMLISLVLAVGVAAVVGLGGESPETAAVPTASQAAVEKTVEKEKKEQREFDPGQKLEINDESAKESAPESRRKVTAQVPPVPEVPDWPQPTAEQVASANAPRYYEPTSGAEMTLTVEAIGLYDVPVTSSPSYEVLDTGLMHEPETSLPWDQGAQRNVFVAGHYLGWPGTASHLVFYNLDKLRSGDEVILEDSRGRVDRYRVSESFEAGPEESWVMGQEVGRDMLTLQTCVPPTFEERLIVRADRA
jgi:sortase A